eukprot:TRINITY_DN29082_c0_g3_i3.p1 TRINITY_DN29082_c0_g3~~TRINITY_DN29082_c0_g3_i3.p1  ORF type:complete len:104 (+),score=12.85 TRINITY_DN29082_c0_g3_i3:246-557(+)
MDFQRVKGGSDRKVDLAPLRLAANYLDYLNATQFSVFIDHLVSIMAAHKIKRYQQDYALSLLHNVKDYLVYSPKVDPTKCYFSEIGRAVQQECRDRSRMPSSA